MAIDIKKIVEETIEQIKLVDSTSPTELLQDLFITAYRFGDGAIETLDAEASLPDITDPDEQNIYFVKDAPFANPQGELYDGGALYFRTSTGWKPQTIANSIWNFGETTGYMSGGSAPVSPTSRSKWSIGVNGSWAAVPEGTSEITAKDAAHNSETKGYMSGTSIDGVVHSFNFSNDAVQTETQTLSTAIANATPTNDKKGGKGYIVGGTIPGTETATIQSFPFADPTGNSVSVGTLGSGFRNMAGISSQEKGYVAGGVTGPAYGTYTFSFPYTSNTPFGTVSNLGAAATLNFSPPTADFAREYGGTDTFFTKSHGYLVGGKQGPATTINRVDKLSFASETYVASNPLDPSGGKWRFAAANNEQYGNAATGYGTTTGTTSGSIFGYSFANDGQATDVAIPLSPYWAVNSTGHHI